MNIHLFRFGIDVLIYGFSQKTTTTRVLPMSATAVYQMSKDDKVEEAIRRALPLMPADARREVEALLTKESIAVMVGVLTLWALFHFIGVGEIADVVLLVAGVAALGSVAVQVAQDLYKFGDYALNAKSEQELDQAAKYIEVSY